MARAVPWADVPAWMATALLMVQPALQLVLMRGAWCLAQLAWAVKGKRESCTCMQLCAPVSTA